MGKRKMWLHTQKAFIVALCVGMMVACKDMSKEPIDSLLDMARKGNQKATSELLNRSTRQEVNIENPSSVDPEQQKATLFFEGNTQLSMFLNAHDARAELLAGEFPMKGVTDEKRLDWLNQAAKEQGNVNSTLEIREMAKKTIPVLKDLIEDENDPVKTFKQSESSFKAQFTDFTEVRRSADTTLNFPGSTINYVDGAKYVGITLEMHRNKIYTMKLEWVDLQDNLLYNPSHVMEQMGAAAYYNRVFKKSVKFLVGDISDSRLMELWNTLTPLDLQQGKKAGPTYVTEGDTIFNSHLGTAGITFIINKDAPMGDEDE